MKILNFKFVFAILFVIFMANFAFADRSICGPLMSNEAGTKYCCAETNLEDCHASACP